MYLQACRPELETQEASELQQVETLEGFIRDYSTKDPRDARVTLSISLLLEYILSQIFLHRLDSETSILDRLAKSPILRNHELGRRSYARAILRQQGWCPYDILRLTSLYSSSGVLFLAHMQRPKPQSRHYQVAGAVQANAPVAAECSWSKCKWLSLNDATYETRHVAGCVGCTLIEVNNQELHDILSSGTFPVVLVDEDDSDSKYIRLVPWTPEVRYVAISHVWSDGLGNVRCNSLPQCQLQRLKGLVQSLDPNCSGIIPFWLDTLCVPPDSANTPVLQELALEKMRDVYSDAVVVLVLDEWLLSVSLESMTAVEAGMRIFSCTWNTRLWTFQEAGLAQKLICQFADSVCDLDAMMDSLRAANHTSLDFPLIDALLLHHAGLRSLAHMESSSLLKRLMLVMGGLALRTTSVATDEAICLSNLLGLDTGSIIRADPAKRMQLFWKMIPAVPIVLLQDVGPKIQAPGLSWAPTSLLFQDHYVSANYAQDSRPGRWILGFHEKVKRTDEGLRLKRPGLLMSCGELSLGERFYVVTETGQWIRCLWTYIDSKSWSESAPAEGEDRVCSQPFKEHNTTEVAWIADDDEEPSLTNMSGITETTMGGTLIAITAKSEGLITGPKLGYLWLTYLVREYNKDEIQDLVAKYGQAVRTRKLPSPRQGTESLVIFALFGRRLSAPHEWCIA